MIVYKYRYKIKINLHISSQEFRVKSDDHRSDPNYNKYFCKLWSTVSYIIRTIGRSL